MDKEMFFLCLIGVFLFVSLVSGTLVDDVIARVNGVVCIFICIIWYLIAGVAAILLVLAGIKYMSSESPDERDESRRRIFNALVGLIIVLIAVPFVNYVIQNTNIMAFRGCNCVFPPSNMTTTTTPTAVITTTPIVYTTPGFTETTTTVETTTTTTGGILTCYIKCKIDGYKNGACKDICDSDEIDRGTSDDCSLPKTCCCIPYPSTTTTTIVTTTTTAVATTTTVGTTTTFLTTTTTTTTIPCAKPGKCSDPANACSNAQRMGRCWETGDGLSLEKECGVSYVNCCCEHYSPNCC